MFQIAGSVRPPMGNLQTSGERTHYYMCFEEAQEDVQSV